MVTYNTIQSSLIFSYSATSGNEEVFLVFMKEVYFPKLDSIGKKIYSYWKLLCNDLICIISND